MNLLHRKLVFALDCNDTQWLLAAFRRHPSLSTDRNSDGNTLLHWTAAKGSASCLRTLLAAGASIEVTTPLGATALHLAAQEGHEACVRELLAAGANVEAAANNGSRPLHIAAQDGHVGCLQQLLDAGADADATHNEGGTALIQAAC